MNNDSVKLGALVKSLAGREMGETFVIIGKLDNQYVLIVNGKNRTLKKPKKKKIKHLEYLNVVDESIEAKLVKKRLLDADIKKSIKLLLLNK